MKVELDAAAVHTPADFHAALADAMSFPAWYGGNLDAMADCLSDIGVETELTITSSSLLLSRLGTYALRLQRVLCSAAEQNPFFSVYFA